MTAIGAVGLNIGLRPYICLDFLRYDLYYTKNGFYQPASCQDQFFADVIDKFHIVIFLQSLNSFCNCRLGDEEFCGRHAQISLFDR